MRRLIYILAFMMLIPTATLAGQAVIVGKHIAWWAGYGADYLTARNLEDANNSDGAKFRLGQDYTGGNYYIYRTPVWYLAPVIPEGAVIDSATVVWKCEFKNVDGGNFTMHIVDGTYPAATNTSRAFWNAFSGWAPSGVYSITDLSVGMSTTAFAVNDSVRMQLSADGLTHIIAEGDTIKHMFISSIDVAAEAPKAASWVGRDATTDKVLLKIYWTEKSDSNNATRAILRKDGVTTPLRTGGVVTPLKRP